MREKGGGHRGIHFLSNMPVAVQKPGFLQEVGYNPSKVVERKEQGHGFFLWSQLSLAGIIWGRGNTEPSGGI